MGRMNIVHCTAGLHKRERRDMPANVAPSCQD